MNQNTITMQVVGRPRTVTLGVPIQQRGSHSSKESLRWRRGEWAGQRKRGHRESLLRRARRLASRFRSSAVALSAAAAVLIGSGLLAYFVPKEGTDQTLPFEAPVQSQSHSSVRIVQEEYKPLSDSTQAVAMGRDQTILPQEVMQRDANSTPPAEARPVVAIQLPARKEASALPHGLPSAPPAGKTKPAAAVILDEAQSAGGHAVRQSPLAVPQKASAEAPGRGASAASGASLGTGLVAVTPDGKVAVFTDPRTRMPAQFKVGDSLPNGETLRAIDAKTGKVTTSAKEYELE